MGKFNCEHCGIYMEQGKEHRCPLQPAEFQIVTTLGVLDRLRRLRDTGLFGVTEEAVAEELIRGALQALEGR